MKLQLTRPCRRTNSCFHVFCLGKSHASIHWPLKSGVSEQVKNMSIIEYIGKEAGGTVISIITTSICAGFIWLANLRRNSNKIRKLIEDPTRQFVFYYRGSGYAEMNKRITFNADGTIGEGANSNESTWKVNFGRLKLFNGEGKLYSEFRWDQKEGKLLHTNDPKLPSVMGQYMVPFFLKPKASEKGKAQ